MSDPSGTESNSIQEPSSGLGARTVSTGIGDMPHQCVVISLVRHAQCEGNVSTIMLTDDAPSPLTEKGRRQADSLGRDWADTRIDLLLSSPLQRAHDTAKALSTHNEGHPKIVINHHLVERRYGAKVPRLMRESYIAAKEELRGQCLYSRLPLNRDHCPGEGGESMNMVGFRAETIINWILCLYAVKLSEPPEFFLEKKTIDTPGTLPDGIPHIVIVSHNVFLMELYEKLYSWGRGHSETDCDWRNADWSRHILWYDEGSDKMEVVDMKYCGS